jgi:hypothetical protein
MAVLKFAGDFSLHVKETPAEVEAAIREAAQSGAPLLHFTATSSDKRIAVNPVQICTFW